MYELEIFTNEPIYIQDVGELNQPLIKDIIRIGEYKLSKYLGVLSFTKDNIEEINENKDLSQIRNFDIIFLIKDRDFRKTLIECLEFFTGQKINILEEVGFIAIGKQGRLHRDNYDDFVDVILTMFARERIKPKKRSKDLSEKQKEIYEKIMKHRKRYEDKNKLELVDIMTIARFGGSSILTREEIKMMTYFELIKLFEVIISKENYNEYLRYKTSPNFKVEESVQHWTVSIKNKK